MIHLDTNYLIGLLVKGSSQAVEVDSWLEAGEALATSAVAWTEFLNGPVSALEISRLETTLQSRIIPFGPSEAVSAAELFNKVGRRRGSRFDCMIAATAILARAKLATADQSDFKGFVSHGLTLASTEAVEG